MDSAVCKQLDSEKSALLLQQIRIPKTNRRVTLACVAESDDSKAAGVFGEKVVDFFREEFFYKDFDKRLYFFMDRCIKEQSGDSFGSLQYGAVLLTDMEMKYFGTGVNRIFLVNRFLQITRVRAAEIEKGKIGSCLLEKGAGILTVSGILGRWAENEKMEIGRLFFPKMDRDNAGGKDMCRKDMCRKDMCRKDMCRRDTCRKDTGGERGLQRRLEEMCAKCSDGFRGMMGAEQNLEIAAVALKL